MSLYTPTQAEAIAKNRAESKGLRKRSYTKVIGLVIAGAGLAGGLAGLPFTFTLAIWGVSFAVWAILRAV